MLSDIKYFHILKQASDKFQVCLARIWILSGDHPFSMYTGKSGGEVIEMRTFFKRREGGFLFDTRTQIKIFLKAFVKLFTVISLTKRIQKLFIDIAEVYFNFFR